MASLNLNKVIIAGHLTSDVELKQTPAGITVTSFTVAVNRRRDKEGNTETDFINCVAWRQTAETVARYFKKGSSICLVGRIQVRSWDDQNGQKRWATEVIADEAYFVDNKGEAVGGGQVVTGRINEASARFTEPTGTFNMKDVPTDEDLPF